MAFGVSSLCSQKHIKREEKVFFSFSLFFLHRFASFFSELLAFFYRGVKIWWMIAKRGETLRSKCKIEFLFDFLNLLKNKRLNFKSFLLCEIKSYHLQDFLFLKCFFFRSILIFFQMPTGILLLVHNTHSHCIVIVMWRVKIVSSCVFTSSFFSLSSSS